MVAIEKDAFMPDLADILFAIDLNPIADFGDAPKDRKGEYTVDNGREKTPKDILMDVFKLRS